jgi:hypothetical protein
VDGVLVLYVEGAEPSARPVPEDLMLEDAVLGSLRAERDAALEEVAYLREQLRSVSAYHAHQLEEERGRMFDERTQLASELAAMRDELRRRTYPGRNAIWSRAGSPTSTSDADVTRTW